MSVQEVTKYATNLRPVLKHLKNSVKSLCLLNDALKLLEIKQMKVLVWCPIHMGYIITSSKRCTELLMPLADVLALCEINKEYASYLKRKCFSGLVVKVLDSQSRGPMFKTTGWLHG